MRSAPPIDDEAAAHPILSPGIAAAVAWAAPALLAIGIAVNLSRPFRAGPVAFDSAMAVLHFDRIVSGHQLEAFVTTTPKPLLTAIFGPLFSVTHDWRALTWVTILAFGLAVTLSAACARRIGGWGAWLFAAVALAGTPALLFDAGLALATPWAMLLWAIAALAVTGERRRYAIAGIALALASLARLETLVVVGLALVVLVVAQFGRGRLRQPVPRGAWWIALGLLAIPVSMLHDLLLTGDPLFWISVSARYSQVTRLEVLSVPQLGSYVVGRYLAEAGLAALGVVGWLHLLSRGQRSLAIGLLGLGPGVAAFLFLLAFRHTYVSDRYFAGVDTALAFAAALGVGALSVRLPDWIPSSRVGWERLAVTAFLGAGLTAGWAGIGTNLGTTVRSFTKMGEAERLAVNALRPALAAGGSLAGSRDTVQLLVPVPLRPHMVVDLGLSLNQVASIDPASIDLASGKPAAGQVLFHSGDAEATSPGLQQLQVSSPTTVSGVRLDPLLADPADRAWVILVKAAG